MGSISRRPRAVVLDLDGTLLNSRQAISGRTKQALNHYKDLGGIVIIASGRPLRHVVPVMQSIGEVHYLVCYNGAYVGDWSGEWRHYFPLSNPLARHVSASVLRRHPEGLVLWETMREWFANRPIQEDEWSWFTISRNNQPQPRLLAPAQLSTLRPAKLLVPLAFDLPEMEPQWRERLTVMRLHSAPFAEISGYGISKAKGVSIVLERLGFHHHEIAVFGDDVNDVPMFAAFPHSYAMRNATADVQRQASAVIASNDEEGVALQLERWLNLAADNSSL